ncbi:MAG: hypothetical protein HY868_23600 [Chloroflexi bacterium]|nr:hypothetical protein [Chloroflexota bacterium]
MNRQTIALVVLGLALRVFLIFPGPFESKVEFLTNKADLRNYYWPAQTALRGENPYALWASGASGEFRSDMAPLELAIYVATVAVWNDPRALQVLFALFDALNIGLLGVLLQRSLLRAPFQIFYALGPLTLYNLTLVPQDKTILLTLTFALFYLLTQLAAHNSPFAIRNSPFAILAIITAALIAAFKWLSVFYLLPLLLFVSRDVRDVIKYSALFGVVVALAHLFWFPDWLIVYTFRSGRVVAPMHIAPAVLLNALGLFDRTVLLGALVVSLGAIYALFWFKRIDILETIALSVMVGILWTPDMDPVHLSIIVIHFLLIVDWTRGARWLATWGLSAWVAFVYAVSTRVGFTRYGLPDPRIFTGAYGSPQMILLAYPLFIIVLGFYVADKLRGRVVGEGIITQ